VDTLNSNKYQVSSIKDNQSLAQSTEIASNTNHQESSVTEVVVNVPEVVVDQSSPEDLDEIWARWRCLICGYNYEGRQTLTKCPRCGNEDPDKFVDAD
jgi:rubrerythrin